MVILLFIFEITIGLALVMFMVDYEVSKDPMRQLLDAVMVGLNFIVLISLFMFYAAGNDYMRGYNPDELIFVFWSTMMGANTIAFIIRR
jgi:cation transporter-like permease